MSILKIWTGSDWVESGGGTRTINNTSATSDITMAVGDTAYIDYSGTGAFTVPLYVATSGGSFEIAIAGDISILAGSNTEVYLRPNNTAGITTSYSNQYNSWGGAMATNKADSSLGFMVAIAGLVYTASAVAHTATTKKYVLSHNHTMGASTAYYGATWGWWKAAGTVTATDPKADTTTAWTSLGTIAFPVTQNGRITVRRIV